MVVQIMMTESTERGELEMEDESAIEFLRYVVHLFDQCNESFNSSIENAEDFLKIARACRKSEWDVYPDEWSKQQIEECLKDGKVPNWEEDKRGNLVPVYFK